MCGPSGGICISAQCKTGADCSAGEECTTWDTTQGCLYYQFACTTPLDTCGGDLDCQVPGFYGYCAVQADGHRQCTGGGCAIGRPFLVDGEARTAPIAPRSDWAVAGISPNVAGLTDELRSELAAAWELIARMEHASIAAFARFSLQLLELGAPPDLIERTNQALVDETKHARAAFALAGAYRGRRVGPGALSAAGALDGGADVATVIGLVIQEGCVGETVAAVEAGEAEERAMDPAVRSVLSTVAGDESDHAELAWRTVRWALATFGDEVRAVVQAQIELLSREVQALEETTLSPRSEVLLAHGVVSQELRATIRRSVLRRAVLPCLKALLDESVAEAA